MAAVMQRDRRDAVMGSGVGVGCRCRCRAEVPLVTLHLDHTYHRWCHTRCVGDLNSEGLVPFTPYLGVVHTYLVSSSSLLVGCLLILHTYVREKTKKRDKKGNGKGLIINNQPF